MNYFEEMLRQHIGIEEFLPCNFGCSKTISIEMSVSDRIKLTCDDVELSSALSILSWSLKGIYDTYGDNYIFSQPQFIYRPSHKGNPPTCAIQVRMLPWDDYKKITADESRS